MDPLSLTASIIAILSLSFIIVERINDVKDSRKERIRLRDEITSASGPLYMLRDRIKQEQMRMAMDPDGHSESWMSSVMALGTPMGPLEQFEGILHELERQMTPTEGKEKILRNIGKSLAWPFQRHDIERYISLIERKKSLFQLALQNDNMTLTQAVKDDILAVKDDTRLIPGIASDVAEVAVKLDKMTVNESILENRAIINWLSPINFFRTHDSIFARRTPGTGQWFLDSPQYRSWVAGAGSTIWCPGIPGAGKTVLSSIMVDNLRSRFVSAPGIGVAVVYCNYKEQLEQTPVNLLAGLWFQLVPRNDELSDDVKQLYRKHLDRNTFPTLTEVEKVLNTEVGRYRKIFIIVDALDECPGSSRTALLKSIQTLQPKVNLLITSRFDDSIAHMFESCPNLYIGASTEDVLTYVSSCISGQLANHIKKDPSLVKEIEKTVVEKAQNMFLLPRLQLESLQEKSSPKAVRKALATLPTDLNRMYDETLLRIEDQNEDYRQLAKQILQWVLFAVRPLSINELQEALAVEEGTQQIDESNVVDSELFTSVCAGLVVFDQSSGLIRLVHSSTQEYFKRIQFTQFPTAQSHLGRVCLTYLSFEEFAAGACSDDRAVRSRIEKHHLLRYAAEHWGKHCSGDSERDTKCQVLGLLNDGEKTSSAVQVMHFTAPTRFPSFMSGLHLAAHFGLESTVSTLLKEGANFSERDGFGATALHRAAEAGQEKVLQLLLEYGADIEAGDLKGHTAIHRATISGKREIVLLLLKKGASLAEATDGRTPLHFAAETGDKAIIVALLEAGGRVNVNAESYNVGGDNWETKFFEGRIPLYWAAQNGHLAVAQVLLEHGARVNAVNSTNRTPLQEAIMFRHTPMVRCLLENGASVHIRDGSGWTPLHEAAWQPPQHEAARPLPPQIAELLIDHGAEIDPINIYTPADAKLPGVEVKLAEAIGVSQHLATYMQLLDKGQRAEHGPVSIHTPVGASLPQFGPNMDEVGCTPLHLAAACGGFEIFNELKVRGADINFCDKSGLVPLHRTVQAGRSNGSLQIIRGLLDAGVDINVRDKRRQETTLQMAARLGRLDRVKYLLERGADIAATNRFGENALQLAEAGGHVEVARVLMEHGENSSKEGHPIR